MAVVVAGERIADGAIGKMGNFLKRGGLYLFQCAPPVTQDTVSRASAPIDAPAILCSPPSLAFLGAAEVTLGIYIPSFSLTLTPHI